MADSPTAFRTRHHVNDLSKMAQLLWPLLLLPTQLFCGLLFWSERHTGRQLPGICYQQDTGRLLVIRLGRTPWSGWT